MTEKELCILAVKAMEKSYSPYSSVRVGAALMTDDGRVFTGCNIENSAYSPSVCAERTAFFKALSEGYRRFSVIAVAGGKNGKIKGAFPPCGVCRQVMKEFCDGDFRILLVKDENSFESVTLRELLPLSFGAEVFG